MKKIACIGPRFGTPEDVLKLMEDIGSYCVQKGYIVASGNAEGSDQAYARGANRVHPRRVQLYLPWHTYNISAIHSANTVLVVEHLTDDLTDVVKLYHPAWNRLSQGVKRLMTRNVAIIEGACQMIYYRDETTQPRGGTYFGIKVAQHFNIESLNLWRDDHRQRIEDAISAG